MIPRIGLRGDYSISRIIKGGWHPAGDHGGAHGRIMKYELHALF